MDFSLKLLFSLSMVLMGLTNFYGHTGIDGVAGQDPPPPITEYQICSRQLADIRANGGWDSCTAVGTFKSKSKCYVSNTITCSTVDRYDYYRCSKSGSTYLLTPFNCPGRQTAIEDSVDPAIFDVCNRYVEGKGCTGTCPPQPPPVAPGVPASRPAFCAPQ